MKKQKIRKETTSTRKALFFGFSIFVGIFIVQFFIGMLMVFFLAPISNLLFDILIDIVPANILVYLILGFLILVILGIYSYGIYLAFHDLFYKSTVPEYEKESLQKKLKFVFTIIIIWILLSHRILSAPPILFWTYLIWGILIHIYAYRKIDTVIYQEFEELDDYPITKPIYNNYDMFEIEQRNEDEITVICPNCGMKLKGYPDTCFMCGSKVRF